MPQLLSAVSPPSHGVNDRTVSSAASPDSPDAGRSPHRSRRWTSAARYGGSRHRGVGWAQTKVAAPPDSTKPSLTSQSNAIRRPRAPS